MTDISPKIRDSITSEEKSAKLVSVIVPCLDEVENVPIMARRLIAVLDEICASMSAENSSGANSGYEIIFVDDGSTDGTREALHELARAESAIEVVSFRRNFGKAAALHAGFKRARGALLVTIDGDLQDDPDEIPHMLARLDDGFDVVSGWKADRKDPWGKRIPSALFNLTLRRFSGIPLHDYNCGLKAYRREAADELNLYGELHRYIPILLHYEGFRVTELPVKHHPRRFGRSKYGMERFTRGFLDMLTVVLLTRYATRPLHAFGGIGLIIGAGGFGVLVYLTTLKIAYGTPLSDRPLLLLGILMMLVGIQLVSTGLLGEMMARSQHARRAAYRVVDLPDSVSARALDKLKLGGADSSGDESSGDESSGDDAKAARVESRERAMSPASTS
jgi:glycosyltransferase involved in cell wall biosynthesis